MAEPLCAVAYLALYARVGYLLPGKSSLTEHLDANSSRYTDALRDADAAWKIGVLVVSRLESLLVELLRKQNHAISLPHGSATRRTHQIQARVVHPKLPPAGKPDEPDEK